MFDKIEQGIDFEWEFHDMVREYSKGDEREIFSLYGMLGSAVLRESGRVASKDGYKIGDVLFGWLGNIMFVDCTSVYSRSDNREKVRLSTKDKDLEKLWEYLKILNTYNEIDRGNVPAKLCKKYDHLRDELATYLDSTFKVDIKDPETFLPFWHPKIGKYGAVNYHGAVAWKYDYEIYVTLVNPQTLKQLGKSDPNIDDILPMSFNLPGFIWFMQDGSYEFLGKDEITMDDVLKKYWMNCVD